MLTNCFPQPGFRVRGTERDKPARECGLKFDDIILMYASATSGNVDTHKVVGTYQEPKSFEDYMQRSAKDKKAVILVVSRPKQTTL